MWRSVANSWPIRLWIGNGIIVSTKNDAWGLIYRGPRAPVVQGSKGPQGPQGSRGPRAHGGLYTGAQRSTRAQGPQGSRGPKVYKHLILPKFRVSWGELTQADPKMTTMGHFHNTRAHRGPRVQGFRGPQGSKGLPTWLDFQMANIIIEMTPHATHMYIQRMRHPTKAHKAPQQPIRHSAYKTPHARHMYIQRIRQNTCTVFCIYTHATSRTAYTTLSL